MLAHRPTGSRSKSVKKTGTNIPGRKWHVLKNWSPFLLERHGVTEVLLISCVFQLGVFVSCQMIGIFKISMGVSSGWLHRAAHQAYTPLSNCLRKSVTGPNAPWSVRFVLYLQLTSHEYQQALPSCKNRLFPCAFLYNKLDRSDCALISSDLNNSWEEYMSIWM